jgi:hypothetical protein
LPQATIKLQPAPAAAAAASAVRKPVEAEKPSEALTPAKKAPAVTSLEVSEDESTENAADDIPLPIAIAAVVLALLAVGVQVWTLIS